ncbi:hypothetical protein ACI65C_011872 [Semiaphis heraclei]
MLSSTNKNNINATSQNNKHANSKHNVNSNTNETNQKASSTNSISMTNWTTQKKRNHSNSSYSNSEPPTSPQDHSHTHKNKKKLFITKNRYEVLSQTEQPPETSMDAVPSPEIEPEALKKKLAGKRDDRRRRQIYGATGTTPVDELLYYDNEAVDNMINEFIDNRQKTTVCNSHHQT